MTLADHLAAEFYQEDEHMRSGHRTYVAMLRGSMIVFTLALAVLAAYAFASAFR